MSWELKGCLIWGQHAVFLDLVLDSVHSSVFEVHSSDFGITLCLLYERI